MRTLISILFAAMLPMLAAAQTAEEKINSIIKGKHAKVGVDGRMMPTPAGPYTVGVVQEVVNFIIPD